MVRAVVGTLIDVGREKITMEQFLDYPGIDWGNVFLASGFPAFKEICVGQPEPIHEVEKILAETSLDDLKTYAEIKVISGATSVLSDDFRAVSFELSKVMSGVQQDRPRWKRAMISIVSMIRRGSVIVSFLFGAAIFHEKNLKAKFVDLLLVLLSYIA